ncbi:ribonuclease HII [Thermodesulfobacteriota bacterium]
MSQGRFFFSKETRPDPYHFERKSREKGFDVVAGIDEAGRGPLAGPVVAAAVILDPGDPIEGLRDSKQLTPKRREALFPEIRARSLSWGAGVVGPHRIDETNILAATLEAMALAVSRLRVKPGCLLVDGISRIPLEIHQELIKGGDRRSASISAASILAKVIRDRIMRVNHERFPVYGLDRNKGYPTREHRRALAEFGPTQIHRFTFRGVKDPLETGEE